MNPVQLEIAMTIETTYTHARQNLAALFDSVTEDREIILVKRRGGESVALIAADELNGLLETIHLLRSPKNAERLLNAINRAKTETTQPQSIQELREEVGLVEG